MESQERKLFQNQDKSPMVFCLRPCSIKTEVKTHIVDGGGLCFQNITKVPAEYHDQVVSLLPDGEVSKEANTLSVRYIFDCVKEGRLLPKEDYNSRSDRQARLFDVEKEGRMPYSKTEDINILIYVRNAGTKGQAKLTGNAFWKNLERENTFQLHGRSWQSLRDRYLKHLKGRESEYPLEGRVLGPLPMPPRKENLSKVPPIKIESQHEPGAETGNPGSFLAEVEARRNTLSPGLSQREYHILINDFITSMEKQTKLNSKCIHKAFFKCNGNEEITKYFLLNGECPEGFHIFSDVEDKILLKCLLNPAVCDELPAKKLAEELGEQIVLDRAAALLGVSRSDFQYMKNIPLKHAKTP